MSETSVRTAYDEVPYPAGTYPQSHPRRLATIAAVFGLEPAEIHRARVLELGTADGTNLIPMAAQMPEATFVGVERSARQMEKGQQLMQELDLPNLTLRQLDILEIGPDLGTFDYIIAHGVYSWVPHEVREKILAVCREHLNPQGVAYVSYNTYPGWRMRGMLRDMMLYHVAQFPEPQTKVRQARALIRFLSDAVPTEKNPYGLWLKQELEGMAKWRDSYFYHDSLEEVNEPVYFHQFMARAAQHGLQYLGEAEFSTMVASNFGTKVHETLSRVGKNIIAMEQYMDFVRNRMFRQTLLCHAGINLRRNLSPEMLDSFSVACRLQPATETPDLASREPEEFQAPSGVKVTSTQPIVKAAMLYLSRQNPCAIPFNELFDQAHGLLDSSGVQVQDAGALQTDRLVLGDALLKCYAGNLVELVLHPYDCTTEVGARPRTTGLIRKQAEQGLVVSNLRHESANLDVVTQTIVQHLDGKHDRDALLQVLVDKVEAGELVLREDGQQLKDAERVRAVMTERLEAALQGCARGALLLK